MNYEQFPKFIEIQTTDMCNGKCTICPSQYVPRKGIMSEDLFKKIIDEISTFPNNPRIIPYLNGEPLLDPHICKRLGYIHSICPESEIEISTNLSNLKQEHLDAFNEIELDDLRISCFGFTKIKYESCMTGLNFDNFLQKIQQLYAYQNKHQKIKLIEMIMVRYEDLSESDIIAMRNYCHQHKFEFNLWGFLDRSQNVVNYTNNVHIVPDKLFRQCELNRLNERMYILSNGDVIPCCDDWYGKYTLGNINNQSLLNIWNGATYKAIREKAYGLVPNSIPELCSKCKLYKEVT